MHITYDLTRYHQCRPQTVGQLHLLHELQIITSAKACRTKASSPLRLCWSAAASSGVSGSGMLTCGTRGFRPRCNNMLLIMVRTLHARIGSACCCVGSLRECTDRNDERQPHLQCTATEVLMLIASAACLSTDHAPATARGAYLHVLSCKASASKRT